MPKFNAYDPDLQQKVGKWANIVIIIVVIFALSRCFAKSPEEKLQECFIKEMRGQGEDMRETVAQYCITKTKYKREK